VDDWSFRPRRLFSALVATVIVLAAGTVGFALALGDDWEDALYRSVVTSTLTGLDNRPSGTSAEVLTIFLVLAGVAIYAYVASILVEAITRGVVAGAWAEKRRRRMIERLRDHFIICGYGRVGRRVAAEFRDAGVEYVVVDFHADAVAAASEHGEPLVEGSATEDEHLEAAGIHRARGIVVSADSDTDNLYVVLSARAAHPELLIVARASDEGAAKKLRLAGADRVIQPYVAAGREMAKLVLRPQVAAFLDVVSASGGPDFLFEEIEVTAASGQTGKSLRELRVREQTGAIIVAIRKHDGTFDTTPSPSVVFEAGDVMIGVGTSDEIRRLEELFAPRKAVAG
jgi:voltage-gated potassium channel